MYPFGEQEANSKPAIPFSEFHRNGMGTEYVAPFLYSMARMVRPIRMLEIGLGYSTPWLLKALDDNTDQVHIDTNCSVDYFRQAYEPLLLCIDDLSISDDRSQRNIESLRDHRYLRFLESRFQGQADRIEQEYGQLDFVWFDCGGPPEYEAFCEEYLPICCDYVFFHFTYFGGRPNQNRDIISKHLKRATERGEKWFSTDIVEPHKYRQGSLTMLRRNEFAV